MIAAIRRYVRAFVLALQFTVRGEKPPLLQAREAHPQFAQWWAQTIRLVEAVERAAAANHVNAQTLTIHVDKRDVRMATILAGVKYHARSEYPYLLVHGDPYERMTVQALNLNDRYLVVRLAEALDAPVKTAVEALSAHLEALPSEPQ